MFNKNNSDSDMIAVLLTSAILTLPFIYYAKDISKSLRAIAANKSSQPEA